MIRSTFPTKPKPTQSWLAFLGFIADRARPLIPLCIGVGSQGMALLRNWPALWAALAQGVRIRWDALQLHGKAYLAPKALAAALGLPPVVLLSFCLQHGTPIFEIFPWLSNSLAVLVAGMAGMVGVGALARQGAKTPAVLLALAMSALAVGELGILHARHRYQNERWATQAEGIPRQQVALPKGAIELGLHAPDGVFIRATYLKGGHSRAIILMPGWHGSRRSFATTSLAMWLGHRFDVLVLDMRGQGDSGGSKAPDLPEKGDVLAALRFLQEEGHSRIAFWAEEEAGLAAIAAAALRPGVAAVAWAGPSPRWGGALDGDGSLGQSGSWVKRLGIRATMALRLSGGSQLADAKGLLRLVAPTPLLLVAGQSRAGDGLNSLYSAAQEPKALILLGNPGLTPSWDRYLSYHSEVHRWLDLVMPSGAAMGGAASSEAMRPAAQRPPTSSDAPIPLAQPEVPQNNKAIGSTSVPTMPSGMPHFQSLQARPSAAWPSTPPTSAPASMAQDALPAMLPKAKPEAPRP